MSVVSPGARATADGRRSAPAAPLAARWGRWSRRIPGSSTRIVLLYAAFAALWIAASDRALEALVPEGHARDVAQTVKGIAFVIVTSALLYVLIRRGEGRLRARSAEVRATVDSMVDAVLLVDRELRVVEANRAAIELLGASSKAEVLGPLAEWAGRFQLRFPDGTAVPLERFATVRAVAGERVAPYEALVRRADGRDVFVSVTAAPVEGGGGGPGLAVAVIRDVSAARRLDEVREEFLSTAAHEFKTPLAVVKAYAQILQRRDPEGSALLVIERQVDRLNRLVEALLDTSRLRFGGRELRRERFDLGRLAGEIVGRMRATAPGHSIAVDRAEEAPVNADRERIGRVVTSLVENAVRFSPGGGEVRVSVERRDAEAVLTVEDHGLGIARERQAHIFERYYRAHAGTPADHGGLGLGLEMSRETIVRHGGRVWFESEPGLGSAFHVSLPIAREEAGA